jgi:enoyl-CoA hydratase
MPVALDLAQRISRHSQLAVASLLTAVTRGINQSIAEGLLVEAEQFARMAPTADLREGLDAWIARRKPSYSGSWTRTVAGA